MKYIVSTDYPLLEQQVEVYNNMYNYPLNDTLTYSNIVKNYQAPIWYINVSPIRMCKYLLRIYIYGV